MPLLSSTEARESSVSSVSCSAVSKRHPHHFSTRVVAVGRLLTCNGVHAMSTRTALQRPETPLRALYKGRACVRVRRGEAEE
jgi:hypothetical protein